MNRLSLRRLRSLLLIAALLVVPVAGLTSCGSDDGRKRSPGAPDTGATLSDTHPSDIFSPDGTSGAPDSSGNPDANGVPDATPADTGTPVASRGMRLGIEAAPGAGLMMSPSLRLSGGISQPVRRDLGRSTNFRLKAHSTTLTAPDAL